jgi:hypothetical protein
MNTTRGIRLPVAVAAFALAVVSSCTDEQRRSLGEVDVADALAGQIEGAVTARGLAIDGALDCSSDIAADGAVTGSCSGTTTSGVTATGTFTGTSDVDAETCDAHLVVEFGAEVVVDDPHANCFATD